MVAKKGKSAEVVKEEVVADVVENEDIGKTEDMDEEEYDEYIPEDYDETYIDEEGDGMIGGIFKICPFTAPIGYMVEAVLKRVKETVIDLVRCG